MDHYANGIADTSPSREFIALLFVPDFFIWKNPNELFTLPLLQLFATQRRTAKLAARPLRCACECVHVCVLVGNPMVWCIS